MPMLQMGKLSCRRAKGLAGSLAIQYSRTGLWCSPWGFSPLGSRSLVLRVALLKGNSGGAWVAHSVERLTSAQVTISRLVSSSPAPGSVLPARSPEPASDSVSPSLSAPPLLALCLSMSLKKKQTLKNKF